MLMYNIESQLILKSLITPDNILMMIVSKRRIKYAKNVQLGWVFGKLV